MLSLKVQILVSYCIFISNTFKNNLFMKNALCNLGAASRHFSLVLLKKSFHTWTTRWQRKVELAQFDDLISYKGDVAVARRVFVHWKYCILAFTYIS